MCTGMLLKAWSPAWVSWCTIVGEHALWVHARLLVGALSYVPDIARVEAAAAAAAARHRRG